MVPLAALRLPVRAARRARRPLAPVVAAALAAAGLADVAHGQGAQLPPAVELHVPKPPAAVAGDGATFLAYELHLTNFTPGVLTLRRIEVLGGDAGGPALLAVADSGLAVALGRPGVAPPPAPAERARIGGGLRAVAFLWVPVAGGTPPAAVRHRLTVARGTDDTASAHVIEGALVPVARDVAVIGPPLRGGDWLAANGPANASGHRRALVPADGNVAIAQRFAIDYVMLDDSGRTFVGDRLDNASYHAQGKEAIAVADGIVVGVKDGIPENVPGLTSRAVPITLETIGGNYVVLDVGGGRHAFYAHLQPGSLRVRAGDRVRRGQVLGLVGNSGNSTEPHLHFHLSDGPSPLGAQGVPYVHEAFTVTGRCVALAGCRRTPAPEPRRREIPMGNTVVRFPDR